MIKRRVLLKMIFGTYSAQRAADDGLVPQSAAHRRRIQRFRGLHVTAGHRVLLAAWPSGAGGARTHDRRIMRTTAQRSRRSTCTDTTEPCHRWPSLHTMHGWLGPRTGPRPPQRAPDVNYGASPHTARDPPICFRTCSTSILVQMAPIWAFCAPFDRGIALLRSGRFRRAPG